MRSRQHQRKGAVAAFLCIMMLPLLALLALSVDYGFLLFIRTDLQRVSDQAALAGVRELIPDANGNQDLDKAREAIREYVKLNLGNQFNVRDSDIQMGRYNPNKIYTSVELLNNGTFDTVRVAIRRDDMVNSSVSLYFARLFGSNEADISVASTAILQKGTYLGPGTSVFPFAMELKSWNRLGQGETASIYGDGRIEDESGHPIPGNWGTVDIGPASNSTNGLSTQIRNGLSQNDIESLNDQGAIPDSNYIDSQQNPLVLNADTGLSSGLKHAVEDVEGLNKLIPIYKKTNGQGGNNLEFEIVGWSTVNIVDSKFSGSNNSYIEVQKSFMYDANLIPSNDLSDTNVIEGAYTSPVLIQ